MIGWILSALTLASLVFLLLPRRSNPLILIALIAACLLPLFYNLSAAEYFRGFFGDLSLTTQLLLYGALFSRFTGAPLYNCCEKWTLFSLIAITGALFYPFALGLTYTDPYIWGFSSYLMLAIVVTLALLAWQRRWYFSTLIISVALLGWSFGLLESRNLWDYLLDPAIFIYTAMGCLIKLFTTYLQRAKKK
ncbi:MAG: hypothetical protein L3J28_05880 [Candidatus Polarisedimenticolaceae bacterium]|nr:hypothetical protein [Candidatus Polarisedimenticolaceae bacterium]